MIRTIHNPQPSHPNRESFSLRNMEESIAEITTESAPSGVFRDTFQVINDSNGRGAYNNDGFDKGVCCGGWSISMSEE